MLIEYKFEFKGGAVTISQHIDLGGATLVATSKPTVGTETAQTKPQPQNPPATMSVIDVPQTFGVPEQTKSIKATESQPPVGGQGHDPAGPGGGGPGGLVIVFGPVIVTGPGGPGSGGGGTDPAGPGGQPPDSKITSK